MSDGLNVGTVKGTVELEDRMSTAVDLLEHKIESLDEKFGGMGRHFAETASSFFTAEAALDAVREAAHLAAETLQEITIEGSHAADIEDTFDHLTERAGLFGDTLLSKTREGLRGTVTDMDIMTRVNQNLAVGLNLTASQMDTLAKGAFALAKATGGDVAGAMDKLSDAMVTGRTRGIAMLTGKIDLTAAEDRFAESLGTTTDHLSEQGKQAAIQQAILEKVGEASERVGDVQVRLADKIQQVKVEFQNFLEELGTAVATSPVIAAGFDNIRAALESAFGDDQAAAVREISHWIDQAAIDVLSFAENAVDAAGVIGQEWYAAKVVFKDLEQVIGGDILVFKYLAEGIAEVGKLLHLPGAAEDVARIDAEIQHLMESMVERGKSIQEDKAAQEAWAVTTGKIKDKIEEVRQKMVAAREEEGEYTDVIRDNKAAHDEAGASATSHGAAEEKVGLTVAMTKEELKKYNESWKNLDSMGDTWSDTLKTIEPEMLSTIRYYIEAGASVDTLAGAFPELTKAQIEAVKSLEESSKAEYEAAEKLSKLYSEYYNKKTALYGTDSEKAVEAADKDYQIRVEELQKKGVKDVEYYNELWDLRNKDIKLSDDARILNDSRTKDSLLHQLAQAKDMFDLMISHRDQYTQHDVDSQRGEIQRLQEKRDRWGEVSEAIDGASAKVVLLDHAWITDADVAEATINKTTVMVKTLSGEVISLLEAQRRQQSGGSMTYDLSTSQGLDTYKKMNTAATATVTDQTLMDLAKNGMTLQQMISAGYINPYGGFGNTNGMPMAAPVAGGGTAVKPAGATAVATSIPTLSNGSTAPGGQAGIASVAQSARAMFDQLNGEQAAMYMSAGRVVTGEQQKIIDKMMSLNIPGFKDGGSGDFGDGTLAMLHGKEAIVPMDAMGGGNTYITVTAYDAEHTARVLEDVMIRKAKVRRQYGVA